MKHLRSAIPVLVVSALMLTGGLLRVSALRSSALFAPSTYGQVLTLHGALMMSMLPLALLWFAPQARSLHLAASVALQALCLLPLPVIMFATSARPAAIALALSFGLVAGSVVVASFSRDHGDRTARATFAVAAAIQCAAWIGFLAERPDLLQLALFFLALAVVAAPVFESSSSPELLVTGIVYALSHSLVRLRGMQLLSFAEFVAGLLVVAFVFRSTRREEDAWVRSVRRVEVVSFLEALSLMAFLGALDPTLHITDTYFALGAPHFAGLVLVFALLRGARRAGRSAWGWLGLGLATVGAHVFVWTLAVLGTRGMPRRYVTYLPQFTQVHRLASVGAFALILGLVLMVAAHHANRDESA